MFARLVESAGGLDKIEALQQHTHQEVYEKAVHLLEVFFAADEEEDIEGVVPDTSGSQFAFGVQGAPDGGFNFSGQTSTAPGGGDGSGFAFGSTQTDAGQPGWGQ